MSTVSLCHEHTDVRAHSRCFRRFKDFSKHYVELAASVAAALAYIQAADNGGFIFASDYGRDFTLSGCSLHTPPPKVVTHQRSEDPACCSKAEAFLNSVGNVNQCVSSTAPVLTQRQILF